ncbi:hypothetical protein DOS84_13655 [Flavobacterium aquariorum]|uniref:Uncharacterized protein n=1 Tax=Flavobacterium aquariorum TaxID=2217670 RepID=A0A2W7TVZ0_9FLAO|nr:hypothetical protein DOS84_13655 [Flavobacterium aquariorum]
MGVTLRKTTGRALRSRFFLNCTAFKGGAIQKKSSTLIPHARKCKPIKLVQTTAIKKTNTF